MRIVPLGSAVLSALVTIGVTIGCNERPREPQPTTTTGADIPAVEHDVAPPGVVAPSSDIAAPAEPGATPDRGAAPQSDNANGPDMDTPNGEGAAGSAADRTARPRSSTKDTKDVKDVKGMNDTNDTSDMNDTNDTKSMRGNSFESSGGTSGLGVYGKKKVPGQDRFDVKPSDRTRDAGR
jgi:hypothetical protein